MSVDKVIELNKNVILMNKKYIYCNELKTQKYLKGSFWQQ